MSDTAELDRLRAMLDPDRVSGPVADSAGYLDLLPEDLERPHTPAQAAMHNRMVAAIYERWWRPFGTLLMGLHRPRMADEHALAREMLGLDGEQTVLDVACGPGNFTRGFGEALSGNGFAIGVDVSPPMLARAVRSNSGERVAYLRGDARDLPFPAGSFDAVCCFAALYLVPAPFRVLDELVRVLAPGGRIAVLTSCRTGRKALHGPETLLGKALGLRMFGRDEITEVFREHGLTDVRRRVNGLAQFVGARRPTEHG